MRRIVIAAAVAALMAGAATPAMASGGKANGGGATNSGGGSSSGGGGGGGGANSGGVNGGGRNDPAPAPTPTPAPIVYGPSCATFQSATAPVGYYSIYAAVWNDFTLRSCSSGYQDVDVEVIDRDCDSGRVDYDVVYPVPLGAGQNYSAVLDNDFAPFTTNYCISYAARDRISGTPLDSVTLNATTPAQQ